MDILGVPFSREEALRIMSGPNFWTDVVFADDHDLAVAYPSLEEWDIAGCFEAPLTRNESFVWDAAVGDGSYWVQHETVACSDRPLLTVSPVSARQVLQPGNWDITERQAA